MLDWNVVVTVHDGNFTRACQILARFGQVKRTEFYNVLVMKVEDPDSFLKAFAGLAATVPDILGVVARVLPVKEVFAFEDAADFEAKAARSYSNGRRNSPESRSTCACTDGGCGPPCLAKRRNACWTESCWPPLNKWESRAN